jgi:hypothetical protein
MTEMLPVYFDHYELTEDWLRDFNPVDVQDMFDREDQWVIHLSQEQIYVCQAWRCLEVANQFLSADTVLDGLDSVEAASTATIALIGGARCLAKASSQYMESATRSSIGKKAAQARREKYERVWNFGLELYKAKRWPNPWAATKEIYPQVEAFARKKVGIRLSARGNITLYEHLRKGPRNSD